MLGYRPRLVPHLSYLLWTMRIFSMLISFPFRQLQMKKWERRITGVLQGFGPWETDLGSQHMKHSWDSRHALFRGGSTHTPSLSIGLFLYEGQTKKAQCRQVTRVSSCAQQLFMALSTYQKHSWPEVLAREPNYSHLGPAPQQHRSAFSFLRTLHTGLHDGWAN